MPNRQIKVFAASPGNQGRTKENPVPKQPAGSSGWISVACIFIGLSLLGGCGGASQPVLTPQVLSQIQTPRSNQDLQHRLMLQAPQAPLSSYKDYQVGPEDLVEVTFFGNDELGRKVRVNGRGEISLPLIGVLRVAGLSPQEIEAKLVQLYKEGKFLRNPQITVIVKEYRHQRVMVTGAVSSPGSFEVIGPRTLLEMLGKAGGLNEKAGDFVHVIRHQSAAALNKAKKEAAVKSFSSGSETIIIDLKRLLISGALELNIPIQNGDVIHVPHAQAAYVLGAVKRPGEVLIKDKLTVTQALSLSQGLDPSLASNSISILRFDENGQRIIIPVNYKGVTSGQDPDPAIKPNDIVFVQESGFRRFFLDFKALMPIGFGAAVPIVP